MYAVVGFEAKLPGSGSGEEWLATDAPAFREVPPGRWPVRSPLGKPGTPDTVPTHVGAFVDGPQVDAEGRDILGEWVAHAVAGALPDTAGRDRTGLVLASLLLPTTGAVRAATRGTGWLAGGHADDLRQAELPALTVARRLGLGGAVDTLDAACASGLFALALAVGRLARHEADTVVAAAVNHSDSAYLFHGFGQLRALSPTGRSRPFDRDADGLLVGEGVVAVALKRLADAVRDGDRIHAVIRGVATGSDGRKGNLLAPSEPAQLRTMRAAWARAGLDPATVGFVECHATGTPVGDAAELRSLGRLVPAGADVVVSSAKGLVGHTVTAAGLAGLLRAVGAVRDGVRLPAVGCTTPRAELGTLRVLRTREPWSGLRRAAVSAFGFGGTNAHVVLEAYVGQDSAAPPAPPPRVSLVAAAARMGSAVVALDGFRIPPVEAGRMLEQQRLALAVGSEALTSGRGPDPARTAVVVGMEVDPAVARAVHRLAGQGTDPPLDADRVQGSLPNFVANRLSAHHDLQGPSFVVGGGAGAGIRALAIAGELLADREDLDAVLVGAVDGAADVPGAVFVVVGRSGGVEVPAVSVEGTGATAGLLAVVRAAGFPIRWAPFTGPFGGDTLPRPVPGASGPPWVVPDGPFAPVRSLPWPTLAFAVRPRPAPPPVPATAPAPSLAAAARGQADLAASLARATAAFADAHARWLDADDRGKQALARLLPAPDGGPSTVAVAAPPVPTPTPRAGSFDRQALLRHAGGPLSSVFGPAWADLDGYTPRVRMPLPPLLLCDRVVSIEGRRGVFGPARCITEYDVPARLDWTADGRPPAFVVVESGQADLFLVSYLGIDAENRGERVYRLLDCDLAFQGPRPLPGTTLRHDIRIDRFARLGATTLFYFHYDCVDAATGRPVLSMRNGCAGFFTRAELATPKGLRPEPPAACGPAVSPLAPGCPTHLGDDAVKALATGRFSDALGPAFAPADGAALTLPPDPAWRLVHRVTRLVHGPSADGIGEVVYEQDLRDDDWFNPVHFRDDPCMPGTLMYEGCLQAVQVWLLGQGVALTHPEARFEPMVGLATRLRCRGQVVPGHHRLEYRASIHEAVLDADEPWARATVVLSVDGTPVVAAYDCGVRVVGPRRPLPVRSGPFVGRDRVLEYSVGSAVRAFGPGYAPFDGPERRCARMPGPPLLQMTEVLSVEGAAGEIASGRAVRIAYDVPRDAWYWRATDPSGSGRMPWVILLETALQPCGWLTAWQAAGILGGADLYFRNLGGIGTWHRPVTPDTGRLVTTATQTSVSASGAMQVQRFTVTVHDDAGLVFACDTQFGYFTKAALAAQKGLPGVGPEPEPNTSLALAGHPALPRDDLRMLDRVTFVDDTGGARGLGRFVAEKDVDPSEWFFTAHFWLDPVMPGSLGLEAMQQLSRWVFRERTGFVGALDPLPLGREVSWTYRGQVRTWNRKMTVELEVLESSADALVCTGLVRADGLPIYRFERFGVRVADPVAVAPPPRRAPPVAALLDTFAVEGTHGIGTLRLDPALHPWLDAHRPTLAACAVPLAFSLELAAEAATLLAPGATVAGVPLATAEAWLHTADGPVDLTVVAVREGDTVAVTLAVGRTVGAKLVVALGPRSAPEPPPPPVSGPATDGADFFAAGHTFHGPVLHGLARIDALADTGADATLRARPDAELLGDGAVPGFVLDPLLLDAATHPMLSGSPERWVRGLPPGRLAYPRRVEGLRFFGPRPTGDVRCAVRLVSADRRQLVFDVHLDGWCHYRWVEVLVPGGPLLGCPPAVRKTFLFEGQPHAQVHVGRPHGDDGWEVRRGDVVEPLTGTTATLYGAPGAPLAVLALKECVRRWLRDRVGDVHPKDLAVAELRPGVWVVTEAPTLDAPTYVAHLHPTKVRFRVEGDDASAVATPATP